MTRCELIPISEYGGVGKEEDPRDQEEEFYCEICSEYVNGPCSDDYE